MSIKFSKESQTFILSTKSTTYAMKIQKDYLAHLYYGSRIADNDDLSYLLRLKNISLNPNPWGEVDRSFSIGVLPMEYPGGGAGDFRTPAIIVKNESGSTVTDLKYVDYRILSEKPTLEGLPSTYIGDTSGEVSTLEIMLEDAVTGLAVNLYYTVFADKDVIARHTVIKNTSHKELVIEQAYSGCLELPDSSYDLITLPGTWSKERVMERQSIRRGIFSFESKRGTSSHQNNPFAAITAPDTNEMQGDAYGITLVYSGNFSITTEVNETLTTRIVAGINPYDFNWTLAPDQTFTTPELLMTFSDQGIGQMSRNFHDLMREHLIKDRYKGLKTPILINSWEASYFDFDQDSLLALAKQAAPLGIDLFVMDDGWFGNRNDDTTSLGDWYVNENKLKGGLPDLIAKIKETGMNFGLWIEPEMVSPDSELYKQHPDWCLHVAGRVPAISRSQLVLDLSRDDVVDYIGDAIIRVLSLGDISYIKWDMNRHLTDVGSAQLPSHRQRETWHRYVLGVYKLMARITERFPNILFESCSAGGGRFDAGMLYYMPQAWTSDNTDAIDRLFIQYGSSLAYPVMAMGTHVSASPSHSVNRTTNMATRGDVAMFGTFGYELDLAVVTEEEKEQIKHQIEAYHQHSNLIRYGDYYRLLSPGHDNGSAWMIVSPDKEEALVCFVQILSEANALPKLLKLAGLDPDKKYAVNGEQLVLSGATLMNAGLLMEFNFGDYLSQLYYLKSVIK